MADNNVSIIFGASGQDGFYMTKLLEEKGHAVIRVARQGDMINGDVSDYEFVTGLIMKYHPGYIFHFAANSSTRHEPLFENHETISTGTLNILECVRLYSPASKVFLSGSALQFKNDGNPINEKTPFESRSPYAVARIQSIYAGRYFRDIFSLKVYAGYFFNHDSSLRSEQHINQKIVRTIQRIGAGKEKKLSVGDIDVQKEFNYAGDIMEAVWTLVNQENIYEAVIGSGRSYRIGDWVNYCFEKLNLDPSEYLQIENDFVSEYKILKSDPALIMGLGYAPKVNFYQLADMMINNEL